jgi:hypothetical protein
MSLLALLVLVSAGAVATAESVCSEELLWCANRIESSCVIDRSHTAANTQLPLCASSYPGSSFAQEHPGSFSVLPGVLMVDLGLTRCGWSHVDKHWVFKAEPRDKQWLYRDFWGFNVAAFLLARQLGVELVPETVEKQWGRRVGALSCWKDGLVNLEVEDIQPRQRDLHTVFVELVGDMDHNDFHNTMFTAEGCMVMYDFGLGFRKHGYLLDRPFVSIDRVVYEGIQKLEKAGLQQLIGKYVEEVGIEALLKRRDFLLKKVEELVREHGEEAVILEGTSVCPSLNLAE